MRSIEDQIKFYRLKSGWYLGDLKIEVEETHINGVEVIIAALAGDSLAYYSNGKIFISKALAWFASLPQRRLAILHEYAHSYLDLEDLSHHEKEYACDRWALREMIRSGLYSIRELRDAINLFGEVINEEVSKTHPSSKNRYKRLKRQLREYV